MSVQLQPIVGQTVLLKPVTAAIESDLKGAVVRDEVIPVVIRDSDGISRQCTVQDRVVKSTDTGHLHFYHRIQYASGGHEFIRYAWRRNFPTAVFVGWRSDGLGKVEPLYAARGTRVAQIIFTFGGSGSIYKGIPPGDSSRFFYIKTKATDYQVGGETTIVLMEGGKASIKTAQPSPVLPRPRH